MRTCLATSAQVAASTKLRRPPAAELVDRKFTVSQSGVSQHLKVLRDNGFATVRNEGTRRMYTLDTTALRDVDAWLAQFRRFWEHRLDALATEVARGKRARRKHT